MINEIFKQLGLNDKEIAVYLEILRQGKTTPALLARATKINRATVYAVAKRLVEKKLVFESFGEKITHFVAKPIEDLEALYETEKRELSRKKKLVAQAIEELESYPKDTRYSVPKIRFVQEEDLEDFLYKRMPVWSQSAREVDSSCWGFQDHSFAEKFQKWISWAWKTYHLKVNLLSNESKIEEKLKHAYDRNREIRFWKRNLNFTASTWVNGEYVVMIVTRQKPFYAVEIHDAVLAHNLREMFKEIWKEVQEKN